MREIKFRAWDKEFKKMLYTGDVNCPDITCNGCPVEYGTRKNLSMEMELLQFTGLLDKNSKEIYEGDVYDFTEFYNAGGLEGFVEGDRQHRGIVEWDQHCAGFVVGDFELGWLKMQDEEGEVVGNIYENPELLAPETNPTGSEETNGK